VSRSARGFALPLVLMFALTATIIIGVMLERLSAGRIAATRQVENYRESHSSRGVQELLDAWLRTLAGKPIQPLLPTSGPALRLELSDGTTADVTLSDGQTRLRVSGTPLPTSDIGRIMAQLETRLGVKAAAAMTRSYGPEAVSVNTAPQEILAAIGTAFTDGLLGDKIAAAIVSSRASGPIDPKDLDDVVQSAGVTPEQWEPMQNWLSASPGVWRIEVTRTGTPPGPGLPRPTETFAGYALLGSGRGAGAAFDATAVWSSRTAIREWRRQVLPNPEPPSNTTLGTSDRR
jgi:hypothetical protein